MSAIREIFEDTDGRMSSSRLVNVCAAASLIGAFVTATASGQWDSALRLAEVVAMFGAGVYTINRSAAAIEAKRA